MLLKLAGRSLANRRATALLTLCSLAISVALLLGIDHLRHQAKQSFTQTLSGTDLIVGARGGQLNLLLYSVFRMGNPTNNISWASYRELGEHPHVDWTVPLSLGDAHRGFRVLGTSAEYFQRYRYGQSRELAFARGRAFDDVFEAVLGARVARELGYAPGEEIIIAHGLGQTSFAQHEDHPFTVVGILEPTGTPVDQTVHVSLAGIEAIHIGWQDGAPPRAGTPDPEAVHERELTPESITAALVGLQSRAATFAVQRHVNNYRAEPLMAILPGVALSEFWSTLGMVENLLLLITALVLLAALAGMVTTLLASMNERAREMAVLRAVGARPAHLFLLVQLEVILLAVGGVLAGALVLALGLQVAQPLLASQLGLYVSANPLQPHTLPLAGLIVALAALSGLVPATAAYRRALGEGLSPRL